MNQFVRSPHFISSTRSAAFSWPLESLIFVIAISSLLCCSIKASTINSISSDISFVTIGNPGNEADSLLRLGPVGSVDYVYRIGKYEVTNAQYTEFLNGVDPNGSNALQLHVDSANAIGAGIELRRTNPSGSKFVVTHGRELQPIAHVSWYAALRFANWLHNGKGGGDTEEGAYTLLGGTPIPSNALNITRNANAAYWLPTGDEWHKAAYHDASAGTEGNYFDYATGSNNAPHSNHPDADPAGVNYYNDDGISNGFNDGFALTGLSYDFFPENPYTKVGAYASAASPYGTFDQNGNVNEWIEDSTGTTSRLLRGGSFRSELTGLQRVSQQSATAFGSNFRNGFRVATIAIPEPYSSTLCIASCMGAMLKTRRLL